ncbi:hypothetical protein D3C72_1938100 [compost metagenome]
MTVIVLIALCQPVVDEVFETVRGKCADQYAVIDTHKFHLDRRCTILPLCRWRGNDGGAHWPYIVDDLGINLGECLLLAILLKKSVCSHCLIIDW